MQAIETEYNGHHFRSRLEARWAVFFDHMKWKWQYEPQGYDIGGARYLPDFFVVPLGWVEVKGSSAPRDLTRLIAASGVDGLPWHPGDNSIAPGAVRERAPGFELDKSTNPIWSRILVLGDIPGSLKPWTHLQLGTTQGDVTTYRRVHLAPGGTMPIHHWLAAQPGWRHGNWDHAEGLLKIYPHGSYWRYLSLPPEVERGYAAARSARFEHGHSGAVSINDASINDDPWGPR